MAEFNVQLDVQDPLIPLRRPSSSQRKLPKDSSETASDRLPSRSHLENDVLFQYQGPLQLGSDRNKALNDLLDILVRMFTRVRK